MDKKEDVWEFEKLEQQLHSFLEEMSELSRKKPDSPVNKFKLKFVNGALEKLNRLLGDDRPFQEFQLFDVDELPSNSDVVVILAQYAASVHRFRTDHSAYKDYKWWWVVNGKTSNLQTDEPEHFKYQPK